MAVVCLVKVFAWTLFFKSQSDILSPRPIERRNIDVKLDQLV